MAIGADLAQTLDVIAAAAEVLQDPWWIIGSTAACLVGLDDKPADVDLITSEADAHRLLSLWKAEPVRRAGSDIFKSSLFETTSVATLPIEIMAGLLVRGEPLVPNTRDALPWNGRTLYVPEISEQIAILEGFGRDKDWRRADRLKALL